MQGYTSAVHIRNKNEGLSILCPSWSKLPVAVYGAGMNWATSKSLTQEKSVGRLQRAWAAAAAQTVARSAARSVACGGDRRDASAQGETSVWRATACAGPHRTNGDFMGTIGFYGGYNWEIFILCAMYVCVYTYVYIIYALTYIYITVTNLMWYLGASQNNLYLTTKNSWTNNWYEWEYNGIDNQLDMIFGCV